MSVFCVEPMCYSHGFFTPKTKRILKSIWYRMNKFNDSKPTRLSKVRRVYQIDSLTRTINYPYTSGRYTLLGSFVTTALRNGLPLSCTLSRNMTPKIGLRLTFTLLVRSKKTIWTISLYVVHFYFYYRISLFWEHHGTDCVFVFYFLFFKVQDVGAEKDAITFLRSPTHYGRPNWDRLFPSIVEAHPDTDVGVVSHLFFFWVEIMVFFNWPFF